MYRVPMPPVVRFHHHLLDPLQFLAKLQPDQEHLGPPARPILEAVDAVFYPVSHVHCVYER